MRRIYIISALLSALVTLSACRKSEVKYDDGYERFSVSYGEGGSKTVIDGLSQLWTPSDKIVIYDGKNNEFVPELSAPAATADFKGKLNGQAGRTEFLAASPYNEAYSFRFNGKGVFNMVHPAEQTAVKGSYDPAALLAISFTSSKELNFRNLGSLVKFTIGSDGVKSVKFQSKGEELLSGKLNAFWRDGDPNTSVYKTDKVIPPTNHITLTGNFEKNGTYYIVTLPAQLESGFTLVLNEGESDEVVTMEQKVPANLTRSGLINLGVVSLNPDENQEPSTPVVPDQGGNEDGGETGGETGGGEGENPGGEQKPATPFQEVAGKVVFYVEADAWHLYLWSGANFISSSSWPGKLRDDYVTIEGKQYAKFVYDDLGAFLGKEIQCLVVRDGYNADGTKTNDSAKFVLKTVNVVTIDNNTAIVVQII